MRFALKNGLEAIELIHIENGQVYQCKIITEEVVRKKRYLVGGWFDFLRQYKLKAGDVLNFYLDHPVDRLYVDIVRRKAV